MKHERVWIVNVIDKDEYADETKGWSQGMVCIFYDKKQAKEYLKQLDLKYNVIEFIAGVVKERYIED